MSKKLITYILFVAFTSLEVMADELADLMNKQISANMATHAKTPLDEGRVSLNQEMLRNPGQIERDITRMPVNIGDVQKSGLLKIFNVGKTEGTEITSKMLKGKKPIEAYNMMVEALIKHIKTKDPSFDNSNNPIKIGKFWITEIIYALSQSLMNPVIIASQNDNAQLLAQWGGSIADEKNDSEINYSPADKTITVTQVRTKVLKNTFNKKDNTKKIFTLRASTHFNIETGKVSWSFGYSLDAVKKDWQEATFPK